MRSPSDRPSRLQQPLIRGCAAASMIGLVAAALVYAWPVVADTTTTGLEIPDNPLITDSQVPPNVLFVLDDSGSMAFDYMYSPDVTSITASNLTTIAASAYTSNTLYYNPASSYQAWVQADGTLMTGGTGYDAVYADFNKASGTTINLASTSSCGTYNYNTSATDTFTGGTKVCGGVQTFYVPKDTSQTGSTYLSNATNYYRYQILTSGNIYRSEYLSYSSGNTPVSTVSGTLASSVSASSRGFSSSYTLAIPANVSSITFTVSGASNSNFTLYVKSGSAVSNTNNSGAACNGSGSSGSASCTISSPTSGATYYANIYATGNSAVSGASITYSYTATADDGCASTTSGYGWRNCTRTTPTGRTEAAERSNYATWFSYHRTRMKAAKAGAASAFNELGTSVRVGYRTIWGRNATGTTRGNTPTQAVPIPVNYNNGLFADSDSYDNRSQWFSRLFGTIGYNGTPLHSALDLAGRYFSSSDSTGAYGPATSTEQFACRQNFTILATDGYWNSYNYYVGGSSTSVDGSSTVNVGEQDNSSGSLIANPNGDAYQYVAAAPYKSSYSNTLADVAMKYWKSDLRTDLSNLVPTSSSDPAFWQHMVTFGISIGMKGTLNPDTDLSALSAGTKSWPNPNDTEDDERIDDLWHAAVNGRGTFLAATNPDEFVQGLTAALASITERTGSFANVAATSASVSTSTQIFAASYVSGTWTGQLIACAATVDNCNSSTASWTATSKLPTAASRKIFTMASGTGTSFPSATQSTVLGTNITAYLRGDQSKELQNGGTLRNRSTVLGDIVDSSPAYVSASNTVYVGANDGMLHAFNATDGTELFAYVPGSLSTSTLASLANADYAHRYFVDGPIVVSTQTQTTGKNLLAGALGRGGKGLYALDVTTPTSFTASNVMWEVTETSGGNMGKILGQPFIAKLNNGVTALVTGNGVNSNSGHAVLLVYNLATGALIKEIDTGSGGATTATTNGLFAPSGYDADGSGTVDYVYAGDLQGHVWKFDLSAISPNSWGMDNSGKALFSATDDSGKAQPITGGLLLAEQPKTGEIWVFFGTGRYLLSSDITDTSIQSLYGIIDGNATVTRDSLTHRSISTTGTVSGYSVRSFDQYAALPSGSHGWYINLATKTSNPEGERVITAAQMSGTTLLVTSIIPSGDACQSNGTSYINALSAFTGTSTETSYFDLDGNGSVSNEVLTDANGNKIAVGSVAVSNGMASQATLLNGKAVYSTSSGETGSIKTATSAGVRVSWREVLKDN